MRQAFQPDLEVLDLSPEAVEEVIGRDALLRLRDGKPNTDGEHRVPTGSARRPPLDSPLFASQGGERSRIPGAGTKA